MSDLNAFTGTDKHLQLGDDENTVQEMSQQVELHQSQKWEMLSPFHDGESFDAARLWRKISELGRTEWECIVSRGNALICLKEMLPHGQFQAEAEKNGGGMSMRTLQRYMSIAKVEKGIDPEVKDLLGSERLLAIIRNSSADLLDKFAETRQIGDADLDDLVTMTPKQISAEIKTATRKLQYELISERAKNDGLFEEKQKLEKANEQLQKKVAQLESGETERPMWWMRGMAIVDAMAKYARYLLENDLPQDDDFRQQAEYVAGRMDREMLEIKTRLQLVSAEHAAELDATDAKLAELEEDERFDFGEK